MIDMNKILPMCTVDKYIIITITMKQISERALNIGSMKWLHFFLMLYTAFWEEYNSILWKIPSAN